MNGPLHSVVIERLTTLVDWAPAITAETQKTGHFGRSHPRASLALRLERQSLMKPARMATSARVAVIAVTEATAWDHVSGNCR